MGVERRHLVDFGLTEAQFLGQRAQMRRRKVAEPVLEKMEIFDQQITPVRAVAQKRAHLVPGRVVKLASLGRMPPLAFP
jgi:hypothetical protein